MAFISPMLAQAIYVALPTRWFSFSSLVGCTSGLLIGMIWKGNFRKTMLNIFMWFAIIESLCGFFLGMYMAFFNQNLWIYAIVSIVYTNLVCIISSKCIMAFKAKLWNDRERETYDNNLSNTAYIMMIIGYISGMIYVPTLKTALFLFGISCIFDDLGWIIVYQKNKLN
jgi:hypothetical protein